MPFRARLSPVGSGAALALLVGALLACGSETRTVVLATTTSVQETGLLDSIVPAFERGCGCVVKSVAVGSGQALALAARGEADVVLSHAPELEARYVTEGALTGRRLVMENDFVLLGPPDDPAGVRGKEIVSALRQLAAAGSAFVSRGDSSGTHLLELALWADAGGERPSHYIEAGQGMSATLRIAAERGAYVMSDRASYTTLRPMLDLMVVSEGSTHLRNVYHVLLADPGRGPRVNARDGRALADYLLAPHTQRRIGEFGVARYGRALYQPAADVER